MTESTVLTILSTLMSICIGGLITWWVARRYYKKAGDELKQEATQLRTISMAVVYMLEHPEANIEVSRDDAGNLVGLKVISIGSVKAGSTVHGVTKAPEN